MKRSDRQPRQGQFAAYKIRVQGRISYRWAKWFDDIAITVEEMGDQQTITTLTGDFVDQSALHGLLQKLHSLGFVLLEVKREEAKVIENQEWQA